MGCRIATGQDGQQIDNDGAVNQWHIRSIDLSSS
jgi:hypothetical protein